MTTWIRMGDIIACPERLAELGRQIQERERLKMLQPVIRPEYPDPEREFWKLFKAGWSPKSLAKRFQITPARVREVLDGKARFPK